jgi:UDP-N-acetylglucosamine acyltransferase
MAYVHLGHDCQVGSHCIIANACSLAGHVEVHDYAIIGGMSGVSQFVRVGAHSYTGGHAGIDRDIPPFAYAMGTKPVYVKGTNLVGLKRRGYSNEVISQINDALKLWIRPEIQKEQCLSEIEALHGSTLEVMEFISFIRKSKMGVTRFVEKG